MRLLLDTHVFLWFISGSPQIPSRLRDGIRTRDNDVYLSVVSVWEASIKHRLGKLPLPAPPAVYLPAQRQRHEIASLPIEESTIAHLDTLPLLHRDPFDRLLICQAIEHQLTLATVDEAIQAYPVEIYRFDRT
jgi:PIN domain nuclease of toxin-antitoxin system